MLYILNTSILPSFGTYRYRALSIDKARELVKKEKFESAIGHEATAKILSGLLEVEVPVNRQAINMSEGDKAIVFKLLIRPPEGKVYTEEELRTLPFVMGLLEKLKDEIMMVV